MGLIDTHTHLESFARHGTLEGALARARDATVDAMITIGTSLDDWALYRDLATKHRGFVHYSVGLHPCSVDAGWEGAVAQIENFWSTAPAGRVPATASGGASGVRRALGE